jgi:hypothetical protein
VSNAAWGQDVGFPAADGYEARLLGPHLRPRSTGRKPWRWTQIGFAQLSAVRTAGLSIPSTTPKRAFRAAWEPAEIKSPVYWLGGSVLSLD